jgi:predicted Fe-Mo cluster-binding NifX family protein
MLACIPTKGDGGLNDTVNEHFGSAPYFTLLNTATDEVTILSNRNAHHDHGTCHPMNQLAHYKIDCVVCTGMGRRAIEALNAEGIQTFHSATARVSDIAEKLRTNSLTAMDPMSACRGHGQTGGCGHSHTPIGGSLPGRGTGYGQGGGGCQGRGQGGGRR